MRKPTRRKMRASLPRCSAPPSALTRSQGPVTSVSVPVWHDSLRAWAHSSTSVRRQQLVENSQEFLNRGRRRDVVRYKTDPSRDGRKIPSADPPPPVRALVRSPATASLFPRPYQVLIGRDSASV